MFVKAKRQRAFVLFLTDPQQDMLSLTYRGNLWPGSLSCQDLVVEDRCVEVSVQKHLPSNVARFEQLMYLSLGLAVIETILERDRFLANGHSSLRLLVSVAWYVYAFVALCIWQAAREQKNWARWALLILFATTLPALLESGLTLIEAILRFAQFFLIAAALFLIFTGSARPWFERSVNQPRS
jgi:hypothetical protein